MNQVNMGDYTKTCYPELITPLVELLGELGRVSITEQPFYGMANHVALIEFIDPPVVQDWENGRLEGALFLNAAGGGCFGFRHCHVRQAPEPGKLEARFDFDLSLDSDNVPLEKHDPQILLAEFRAFVDQAKIGFCYFFSNR